MFIIPPPLCISILYLNLLTLSINKVYIKAFYHCETSFLSAQVTRNGKLFHNLEYISKLHIENSHYGNEIIYRRCLEPRTEVERSLL